MRQQTPVSQAPVPDRDDRARVTPVDDRLWKIEMQRSIDDVDTLLQVLALEHLREKIDCSNPFRLKVPRGFVARMQHGDSEDPLLRQVLPLVQEQAGNGLTDPVADQTFMQAPGLLHKYHGRALLITTGACAINCRYCFRRHYPYSSAHTNAGNIDASLEYLQQHGEIDEVILSGGDPLMLDDARLHELITRIETVSHIRYLRIHTRLPVVLPSRICSSLVRILGDTRLRLTVVIHCNHANEIDDDVSRALAALRQTGSQLLNQSVLLAGVNDSAAVLGELSKRLYDEHVIPYYLHLLDPVQGAMHFDVDEERARTIIEQMRARLPGYLVPALVREIPNSESKTAISTI